MTNFKRITIKEELVLITGHFYRAILLDYFVQRYSENDWISKKSEVLASDCLLDLSKQTIRKHLKVLIDDGFLMERNNPSSVWDKTMQYKINAEKIELALNKLTTPHAEDVKPLFDSGISNVNNETSKSKLFDFSDDIPSIELSAPNKSPKYSNPNSGISKPISSSSLFAVSSEDNDFSINSEKYEKQKNAFRKAMENQKSK